MEEVYDHVEELLKRTAHITPPVGSCRTRARQLSRLRQAWAAGRTLRVTVGQIQTLEAHARGSLGQ